MTIDSWLGDAGGLNSQESVEVQCRRTGEAFELPLPTFGDVEDVVFEARCLCGSSVEVLA